MTLEYAPRSIGSLFDCSQNKFSDNSVAPGYVKKYKKTIGINEVRLNKMVSNRTDKAVKDAFAFLKNVQYQNRLNNR